MLVIIPLGKVTKKSIYERVKTYGLTRHQKRLKLKLNLIKFEINIGLKSISKTFLQKYLLIDGCSNQHLT